ncbi:hypothetical protein ACLOJK_033021 [Asimina triloba]
MGHVIIRARASRSKVGTFRFRLPSLPCIIPLTPHPPEYIFRASLRFQDLAPCGTPDDSIISHASIMQPGGRAGCCYRKMNGGNPYLLCVHTCSASFLVLLLPRNSSGISGAFKLEKPMATISERDRSLHNFSFPNWGILRNMKTSSSLPRSDGPSLAAPSNPQLQNLNIPKPASDHHFDEAEKHGESTKRKKPWTLREKKSSGPDVPRSVGNIPAAAVVQPPAENRSKSLRLRSLAAGAADGGKEKKEKRKFSIALSREEINADFVTWTGSKKPRRPRKRPRNVQIELDLKFPGLWLAEINPDSYIIPEMRESKSSDDFAEICHLAVDRSAAALRVLFDGRHADDVHNLRMYMPKSLNTLLPREWGRG